MTPFSRFAPALRRRGFVKRWTAHTDNGLRCDRWELADGVRTIIVRLWDRGSHTVTHSMPGQHTGQPGAWEATHPTPFTDGPTLDEAIRVERTRRDHPYYKGDQPYV